MKQQKLTFKPVAGPKVKDNIRMFQEFQRGGDCVMGSGRCAEHNVRLVRKVTHKKVSSVNDDGMIKWTTREVTILACPASNLSQPVGEKPALPDLSMKSGGETNKRQRFTKEIVMNQPRVEVPVSETREDIPLDVTN